MNLLMGCERSVLRKVVSTAAWTLVGLLHLTVSLVSAQETKEAQKEFDRFNVSVSLNQDKFFGFYPIIAGTYYLRQDFGIAFGSTLYGHLSNPRPDWSNPWTWVYGGIHKSFMDGKLVLRPQVGFTNGQVNSCGAAQLGSNGGCHANVFDAFLFLFQAHYAGELLDVDGYFVLIEDVRKQGPTQSSFTHHWLYAGVPVIKTESGTKLIVGGYYEDIHQFSSGGHPCTGCLANGQNASVLPPQGMVAWLGGYVELRMPMGMSVMFAAGKDFAESVHTINPNGTTGALNANPSGDFYKVRFTKVF